jgi:hypothetical protein
MKDVNFEFRNVSINILASTASLAYTRLCIALASIDAEYCTDTYSCPELAIESTETDTLFIIE